MPVATPEPRTLTRTSVQLKFTTNSGYRSEFTGKGGKGSAHRVTGEEVPPQAPLLAALKEVARLSAVFGFEAQARAAFEEAVAGVPAAGAPAPSLEPSSSTP